MMRVLFSSTALALICSSCVMAPPPVAVAPVTGFQTTVSATDPNCHDYTGQGMIDGKPQQLVGHACKQPDGSWKVAEGTADQPAQFVAVYPAPIYADGYYYPGYYPGYFYGDPWIWDASFGFGTSFVFFDHHFHHRDGHGGFHGSGFHHR